MPAQTKQLCSNLLFRHFHQFGQFLWLEEQFAAGDRKGVRKGLYPVIAAVGQEQISLEKVLFPGQSLRQVKTQARVKA